MRFIITAILTCLLILPAGTANAQRIWPLPGVLHAACDEWIADNPDFNPITENLPVVCAFHYLGWDCEQPWTPAGWLRPGGYCEVSKRALGAAGTGDAPPHRPDPDPCEHEHGPYLKTGTYEPPPPTNCPK